MCRSSDHSGKQACKIEAAVESILIFTEVAVSVLIKVKCVICPTNSSLQVAKDCIDPGETLHIRAFSAWADNFPLLDAAHFSYGLKTPETIRDNR